MVANNGQKKFIKYDREGKKLGAWGKAGDKDPEAFGGCCNPMNVRMLENGDVLTAESSIGWIKRFNKQGELVGIVGKARIGGGCKHCSMGYDAKSDQYYMMAQDANGICVLGSNDRIPSMTEEEKVAAALREKFLDRLLGQWQIGGKAEVTSTKQTVIGSIVSAVFGTDDEASREETVADDQSTNSAVVFGAEQTPFTQATFMADGKMKVGGGMYGQMAQDTEWAWEVKPGSTEDALKLSVSMDQAELVIVSVSFGDENQAKFTFEMYGASQAPMIAKRVADCEGKPCGEKCADEKCADEAGK